MNSQAAIANRTKVSTDATINIRNLRLRTFIGFNPEEKQKQQDVVINIEINYVLAESVLRDQVEDALNYKVITKKVIEHVEDGRFLLLEKLVADVLDICSDHPGINHARVSIDKPHALRFADSVSLALEYRAAAHNQPRHLEAIS
jgi:D-erythro-7,8-dihydroneopterin triphosphate epimerase